MGICYTTIENSNINTWRSGGITATNMREFGAVLELIKHERGSFALFKKIGIETRALGALQVRAQRGDSV